MDPGASRENATQISSAREFFMYGAVALIFGWWAYDLHFHWKETPEYNFGWIVLLLVVYLVADRWAKRPCAYRPVAKWQASALVVLGFPFVLIAELYKNAVGLTPASSTTLSVGAILFISALLLRGQGMTTWRYQLFPVLFMLVAVPVPKIIWNPVVLTLQRIITRLNVEVLNIAGIPATQNANLIRLSNCTVGIDEACSGVRSLQSSVMAGLFLGYILLRTGMFRMALVVIGVAAALAGNFARSFWLSFTAHQKGIKALESLHDTAGWTVLAFTIAIIGIAAWCAARLEGRVARSTTSRRVP